jgi:hypothetical protein
MASLGFKYVEFFINIVHIQVESHVILAIVDY